MKKIQLTIKIMYLSVLSFSLVGIWLKPEYASLCLIVDAVMSLLGIVLIFGLLRKFDNELIKEKQTQESKYGALRSKLEKSEELRQRYRAALEQENAARIEAENKLESVRPDTVVPSILSDFNKNVSTPYFEMLKSIELPLSDSDKQKVVDRTIDVAMLAVDMADAYEWNINNREEQKINLNLISGTISRKDALDKALSITDNPALTPKWARALKQALDNVVSKDNVTIYSGYKKEV